MPVTALNSTTTSEAVSADAIEFTVGSTANISVGQMLVAQGTAGQEAMRVSAIPVSGRVQVRRGWDGTKAIAHRSGTLLWIGAQDAFKRCYGQSPNPYVCLVGTNGANAPDYALPGSKAMDGAGNEYVMVDLTFSAFDGVAVLISRDGLFTAKALASGDAGTVGIITEEATSNQWAWAQVYGAKSYAQYTSGSSLCTSTGIIQPATSASVPAGGLLGRTTSQASSEATARVFGIYPTSAVTTATTAATSATGFSGSVWLNYPFVERAASS